MKHSANTRHELVFVCASFGQSSSSTSFLRYGFRSEKGHTSTGTSHPSFTAQTSFWISEEKDRKRTCCCVPVSVAAAAGWKYPNFSDKSTDLQVSIQLYPSNTRSSSQRRLPEHKIKGAPGGGWGWIPPLPVQIERKSFGVSRGDWKLLQF